MAYSARHTTYCLLLTAYCLLLTAYSLLVPRSSFPDAPNGKLYIDPMLPAWLPDITVSDLRAGEHKLDISFWREGEETKFKVLRGDPKVIERCSVAVQVERLKHGDK